MIRKVGQILIWQGLIALSLWFVAAVPAFASDPVSGCAVTALGRPAEIQSRSALRHFVRCAAHHVEEVGWEQALQDFATQPQWHDGPLYLFGLDTDGIIIFHVTGAFAPGDNIMDETDVDGLPYTDRFLYTARVFGGGFTNYRFLNPETEEIEPKVTYTHPVGPTYEGRSAILGAGFYPQAAPTTCAPSRIRASLVYTLGDAERFVRCAEYHLQQHGLRALLELAEDPRWNSGSIYLYLADHETSIQILSGGNPDADGTYLGGQVDSTGFPFAQVARDEAGRLGEAVAYYEYANPVTGQVEPKISYMRLIEFGGFPYVLGTGIYIPARAACQTMPDPRDVDTRAELELYVRCAADLVASQGRSVFDLLLEHPSWIGGSVYTFINDQECRSVIYPLEYRADDEDCDLTDAEGTPWNKNIRAIANSEEREGYTTYLWLNPASDEVETKTTFVIGVDLDGERVAVGAGLYGLEE